jgi:hypothetical protein
MLNATLEQRIETEHLEEDSVPPDLIAKIQLARAESGFDKPFMLSKYEWTIYQEVLKVLEQGYYRVRKRDLMLGLVLNTVFLLPSIIIILAPQLPDMLGILSGLLKHPLYDIIRWISGIVLNILYGIDFSLYKHGYIRREYLLGIVKHLVIDIPKVAKRKK